MKYSRLVKYFFGLSFMLLMIMPIINTVDFLTTYTDGSKRFNKQVLFNTDKIESVASYAVYKIFDKSIFPDNVVTGKDSFLFLGNRYADVLNKTNGTFLITDHEVRNYVKKLRQLQTWYEKQGIKFIMAISPNKHSIYKEKLPDWIQYDGETITDRILKESGREGIHLVDLRPSLVAAKETEQRLLYQKTDTHWNMLGASYGYEKIIDYINENYELDLHKPKYEVKYDENANHRGGLYRFLKAKDYFNISDFNTYYYDFEKKDIVCHGKINIKNGKLKACHNKENPILATNHQPQYILNKNVGKSKLLFLGDSFSTYHSQLFNMTFNTIWKLHFRKFKGKRLKKFVERNQPDIVLYHIVERDLFNNYIFTPIAKNPHNEGRF